MVTTVIRSVLLFDGHDFRPDVTVSFDSSTGLITSVSSIDSDTTDGDVVIDGRGHTLVPGLIDAHVHVHRMHLEPDSDQTAILDAALPCGVTTVCDMHSDNEMVDWWRSRIHAEVDQAKATGANVSLPDLKSSLLAATIHGGWPKPIVLGHDPSEELKAYVESWPSITVSTARSFVREHKAAGADYIKLMQENCCSLSMPTGAIPTASLDLQTELVKVSHEHQLIAVSHALSVDMTEIVLKSGADGLTHTFIDQEPTERILDLYRTTNAFLIPTLTVLSSITGEGQDYRDQFAELAYGKKLVPEMARRNIKDNICMKDPKARLQYAYNSVRLLKQANIDIVAGTDAAAGLKGTAIGPSMWMELQMYVRECGLNVTDVLRAATSTSARRFGFTDRGVIEPGRRADLVLVGGTKLGENLQSLWEGEGIMGVWKQGLKAVQDGRKPLV